MNSIVPELEPGKTFRSTAGFGKRIEYWIIGRMLKEGMDVYVPLVDDHAVDGGQGDGCAFLDSQRVHFQFASSTGHLLGSLRS